MLRRPFAHRERGQSGTELTLHPADIQRPPRLRLRAAPQRIVLTIDDADLAIAHVDSDHCGVELALRDGAPFHLLPPIGAPLLRTAPGLDDARYVAHWSDNFARSLVQAHALGPGRFAITPATDPAPPRRAALPRCDDAAEEVRTVFGLRESLLSEAVASQDWHADGNGGVFRLRRPSARDASRVRLWRKRAREGVLPPVLVSYVSGLTMFALLDGHDRLAAAVAEGLSPPVMVLWQVRESARPVDADLQAGIADLVHRRHEARAGEAPSAEATKHENDLLLSASRPRSRYRATSRAERLDDDQAAWEARLRRMIGAEAARTFLADCG